MALTPDQKRNLLIGVGVGVAALLGVLLFGRRQADADPARQAEAVSAGPAAPRPLQMPAQSFQPERRKRRQRGDDDDRGVRRRRRHPDDDSERGERGERGEKGRGEYGRKHRGHYGD